MHARAEVRVRVLGPAHITIDGEPAPVRLLWRKHLALLVYLARSPRRARTREHLIGLLWSEREDRSARHSLSEALRVLRRALGDERVQADVDQVRLSGSGIELDCDHLVACSERGEWEAAATLVHGEFLEGLGVPDANEFETWLAAERLAWRTRGVAVLTRWAEEQLGAGDLDGARTSALRALSLEPGAEGAARAAMRALALTGDRAGALAIAEGLAFALGERLATAPAAETLRLIEKIRDARVARRCAARPPGSQPRAPLVGRREDLARLVGAWDRASRGAGEWVLVEGEPGEGKTRLLDELLDRVRLEEASVAVCRAVPGDAATAWSGMSGLLLGGLAGAPGLAGAAPDVVATLADLHPDLPGSPEAGDRRLAPSRALALAVRAAAEERPVLLALDDAQDLDSSTAGALSQLLRDVADRRVLVVTCVAVSGARLMWLEALRAQIGRDLRGDAIRLGRLDQPALRSLAQWWLPSYAEPELDRVVRRVARDTSGVPLLAAAMLEAVADGLRLASDAPSWPGERRTLVDTLPGDLPPAAVGAVCLQYQRLDEPAQAVLAAAAALGEPRCSAGLLSRATGLASEVVERALDRLEWDRWLVADARGYTFAAPIACAVLLQEMITPGQARRFRERAAT